MPESNDAPTKTRSKLVARPGDPHFIPRVPISVEPAFITGRLCGNGAATTTPATTSGELTSVPPSNGSTESVSELISQETIVLNNEETIDGKKQREAELLDQLRRSQEAQFEELANRMAQENLLAKKAEELRASIALDLNMKLADDNIKVGHVHIKTYAFPDNGRSVETVLKAFMEKGWLIRITDEPSTSLGTNQGSFLKKVEIPLSK